MAYHGIWGELWLSVLREHEPEQFHQMEEDGTLDERARKVQDTFTERCLDVGDRIMERLVCENPGMSQTERMLHEGTVSNQAREIVRDEILGKWRDY